MRGRWAASRARTLHAHMHGACKWHAGCMHTACVCNACMCCTPRAQTASTVCTLNADSSHTLHMQMLHAVCTTCRALHKHCVQTSCALPKCCRLRACVHTARTAHTKAHTACTQWIQHKNTRDASHTRCENTCCAQTVLACTVQVLALQKPQTLHTCTARTCPVQAANRHCMCMHTVHVMHTLQEHTRCTQCMHTHHMYVQAQQTHAACTRCKHAPCNPAAQPQAHRGTGT